MKAAAAAAGGAPDAAAPVTGSRGAVFDAPLEPVRIDDRALVAESRRLVARGPVERRLPAGRHAHRARRARARSRGDGADLPARALDVLWRGRWLERASQRRVRLITVAAWRHAHRGTLRLRTASARRVAVDASSSGRERRGSLALA